MKCHECQDLLSPYLDNMTNDEENKRITVHLTACPNCYRNMQEMKFMLEGLASFKGEVALPDGYTEDLHEKLLAHKTSLWGKRQIFPNAPRQGGWIAASVAAFALASGIWISSFVPFAQVADTLQKAAPAIFDREHEQVKPEVEKLLAQTAQEIQAHKGGQQSTPIVNPDGSQQVAVNEPTSPAKPTSNTNSPGKTSQAGTTNTPITSTTPKVVPVVAMQVAVENLDTAVNLLKSEGANQNTQVAVVDDNNVQILGAGRMRTLSIQVPQEQVDKWTNLLGEIGEATPPSQRSEDVTKTYNQLSQQVSTLQQQLADPAVKNTDQLEKQLVNTQKQLQAIKERLQMVTITVKLQEEVTH